MPILIASADDVPEGLEGVTVVDPESLSEEAMSEIEAAAGGGDEPAPDGEEAPPKAPGAEAPAEAPPEHAEAAEGLEEEVSEPPAVQAQEAAAGTELHGGPALKHMVLEKAAQLRQAQALADEIAMIDESDEERLRAMAAQLTELLRALIGGGEEAPPPEAPAPRAPRPNPGGSAGYGGWARRMLAGG